MNTAATQIIRTDLRTACHATGEAHARSEVKVTCSCPACGDHAAHDGTAYRGETHLACEWCGHKWTVAS